MYVSHHHHHIIITSNVSLGVELHHQDAGRIKPTFLSLQQEEPPEHFCCPIAASRKFSSLLHESLMFVQFHHLCTVLPCQNQIWTFCTTAVADALSWNPLLCGFFSPKLLQKPSSSSPHFAPNTVQDIQQGRRSDVFLYSFLLKNHLRTLPSTRSRTSLRGADRSPR